MMVHTSVPLPLHVPSSDTHTYNIRHSMSTQPTSDGAHSVRMVILLFYSKIEMVSSIKSKFNRF